LLYDHEIHDSNLKDGAMQKRIIRFSALATLLIIAAFANVACDQESADAKDERVCASRIFPDYDETHLDQCMTVCKRCRRGNTVTCSTSCKLKGAS
jgi:hypothetical protein